MEALEAAEAEEKANAHIQKLVVDIQIQLAHASAVQGLVSH